MGGAAAAGGGGSGGASQPRHPAGREPPTGNRPFKQRSLCLPGSWRGSGSLRDLRPSVRPSVRPSSSSPPALPGCQRRLRSVLRAGARGAAGRRWGFPCPRVPVSPCPCPCVCPSPSVPVPAPGPRSGTMGCCTGRCTLIFLCALQLVSAGAPGAAPAEPPPSCRERIWGCRGLPGPGRGQSCWDEAPPQVGTKPPGAQGRQGKGWWGQPGARCGACWCLNLGETWGRLVSCWLLWVWFFWVWFFWVWLHWI